MTMFEQWGTFGVLVVVGAALYALILLANRIMRPEHPSPLKLSTYECGVEPVGSGWTQFHIRYYVFAFLFVIFDVETVFIFPWAVLLEDPGRVTPTFALVEMAIFIGILALGILYAWRKKVLRWES